MIINIFGYREGGKLHFQLPNVALDRRFSYKERCTHIHLEKSANGDTLKSYELFALNSNLVDRSSTNPMQSLFHFWRRANAKSIEFAQLPDGPFYSLHLYELENASFDVIRVFQKQKVELENIFIQLEIVKSDPYGRLQ